MAKLYFRYGAMNCGKSTALMQVAHNYEEKGFHVLVIKASIDTKGGLTVTSRIGISRQVDYLINKDDSLLLLFENKLESTDCILVDESQFLTTNQINDLFIISKENEIPVICYGLRADFKTNLFPGSKRLFEVADELEKLVTICHCGKKAEFNARKIDGKFVNSGSQVAIDLEQDVTYEPLCGKCYIKEFKHF